MDKRLILSRYPLALSVPEGFELQCFEQNGPVSEAEIIVGEPTMEELASAERLRWVQMTWAGADRYAHFPKNVRLTTASGAFGETIAEHALGLLFALCRRLGAYSRQNSWQDLGTEKQVGRGTALIFGCGDIGTAIARRLKALNVHTVGVCRNARTPRKYYDALTTLNCAAAFLPEADFVLCALPHSAETAGYFDRERLALMKDDAVFINVGRGSLVDTESLTALLEEGKFFGVGLDVVAPEPLPQTHPLWRMDRVLLTPHVAGVSFGHLPETEEKIRRIIEENLRRYGAGEPLLNQVDIP